MLYHILKVVSSVFLTNVLVMPFVLFCFFFLSELASSQNSRLVQKQRLCRLHSSPVSEIQVRAEADIPAGLALEWMDVSLPQIIISHLS